MGRSFAEIVAERRHAIIAEWRRSAHVQVLVENPERLGRLAFLSDFESADVGTIGRYAARSVALVQHPSGTPSRASIWVRALGYDNYSNAFRRFLTEVYGVDGKSLDFGDFDIDHLLNRKRAPEPTTFVRIEATPSSVNRAWGSTFEKLASVRETHREGRSMSWAIAAKLAGLPPPANAHDTAGMQVVARGLSAYGFSEREVVSGLTNMYKAEKHLSE